MTPLGLTPLLFISNAVQNAKGCKAVIMNYGVAEVALANRRSHRFIAGASASDP